VRLIDADALKSKIREQPWKRETKVSLILEWIYTLIDEASTVQNEALQQENERLKATIDEIKGIVGYPGEEALKKHGLTDTLPNIVRYLHREWLEQTHKAGQRCIEKDIEIDKLKDENEQLRAQVARMREALRKAREALCKGISELKVHCKYFDNTPEEDACIMMHEAVIEIDKAIGGKEGAE